MIFDCLKQWWNGLSQSQPVSPTVRKHPPRLNRILIPDSIWDQGMNLLEPYQQHSVEGAILFYGFVSQAEEGIVTTVVCPKQFNSPGYYSVPPSAMAAVARTIISPYRVLLLAQLHLHPGDFTDMSQVDQDHAANGSILGGLQFIVPYYGNGASKTTFVVHERVKSGWKKWSRDEQAHRVVFIPSKFDLRRG